MRWINIDDKIPDEGKRVILFSDNFIFIGYRIGCSFCSDDEYEKFDSVTYWMPLPQSPLTIYEFRISEEDHFNILGRGHTFIIRDYDNKDFKIGNTVIINEQECTIKGIEYKKQCFDTISGSTIDRINNLALVVSGYY